VLEGIRGAPHKRALRHLHQAHRREPLEGLARRSPLPDLTRDIDDQLQLRAFDAIRLEAALDLQAAVERPASAGLRAARLARPLVGHEVGFFSRDSLRSRRYSSVVIPPCRLIRS
jgi:hypothetical protein